MCFFIPVAYKTRVNGLLNISEKYISSNSHIQNIDIDSKLYVSDCVKKQLL